MGQQIFSGKTEGNTKTTIDVSDFAKGIYYVKIYTDKSVEVKAFVKN